jgi:ABC-type Fe3+ transport system permease subunit
MCNNQIGEDMYVVRMIPFTLHCVPLCSRSLVFFFLLFLQWGEREWATSTANAYQSDRGEHTWWWWFLSPHVLLCSCFLFFFFLLYLVCEGREREWAHIHQQRMCNNHIGGGYIHGEDDPFHLALCSLVLSFSCLLFSSVPTVRGERMSNINT